MTFLFENCLVEEHQKKINVRMIDFGVRYFYIYQKYVLKNYQQPKHRPTLK